jgi:hypothetical protein
MRVDPRYAKLEAAADALRRALWPEVLELFLAARQAVDRCGSAWEIEELSDALSSFEAALDKEAP